MNRLNHTFDKIGMFLLLVGLPLAGIVAAGKPLADYLEFPPLTRYVQHAGFSWPVFIGLAVAIFAVLVHFVVRVIKSQFSLSKPLPSPAPTTDHRLSCFAQEATQDKPVTDHFSSHSASLPSIHYPPFTLLFPGGAGLAWRSRLLPGCWPGRDSRGLQHSRASRSHRFGLDTWSWSMP